MAVSNKTLAFFILATVIVSLGGTLLSLNKLQELSIMEKTLKSQRDVTGLASGKVELSVTSTAQCIVNSNVSYGAAGQPSGQITISTNGTNTGTGFADCLTNASCQGMLINNTGNVHLTVNFSSSVNGTLFVGGPTGGTDDFTYLTRSGMDNGAEPGCQNITDGNTWTQVATNDTMICQNLTYVDTQDMMILEYNVTLDSQTPPALKTALITITCAQNE